MQIRWMSLARLATAIALVCATSNAMAQSANAGRTGVDLSERESNLAVAERILAQKEADLGRSFNAGYRAGLLNRLASRSGAELEALVSAGAGADLNGPVSNVIGASSSDLVYTPVTPCRIFDTRSGGGQLAGGASRNFVVSGNVGFAAQGGLAAGCGIPTGPATAVMVNFAVVSPAAAGDIRAFAVANPQPAAPLASVLNYGVVSGLVALANGIAIPICDPAATSCAAGEMRIQVDVGATDVLADVVGYFRKTDLATAMPMGSTTLPGTVLVAGNNFIISPTDVSLASGGLCHVTCQVDYEGGATNTAGFLAAKTARRDTVAATNTGDPGFFNDVSTPSTVGSAMKADVWAMTAGKNYRFGCDVTVAGDFIGESALSTVTWDCR